MKSQLSGTGGVLNTGISDPLRIGNVGTNYAGAVIDDVRIYTEALSQDEISQLYTLGTGGVALPPTNPSPLTPIVDIITPAVEIITGPQIYNVKQDGSGNFTTIQACANVAKAGNTCLVFPGTYQEHVSTKAGGTDESHRILFKAQGIVTMQGFQIIHPYVTVENFDITGYTQQYGAHIFVSSAGNQCRIINNVIRDGVLNVYGINFDVTPSSSLTGCIVRGNKIDNLRYGFISISGIGHLFENNILERQNSFDFVRVFGHDHIFRRNIFRNGPELAGIGNHPDFVQTFSENGGEAYNILFEENFIDDIGSQLGQINSGGGVKELDPDFHDFVFRRNVFSNIKYNGNIQLPGVQFINNTFYRLVYSLSGIFFTGSLSRGSVERGVVINNAFVGGGSILDTYGARGWYFVSQVMASEVLSYFVTNRDLVLAQNIFNDLVSNGYFMSNGAIRDKLYTVTSADVLTLSSQYEPYRAKIFEMVKRTADASLLIKNTFRGDYNFVAGDASLNFPSKAGFTGKELHGINGGDPKFVNISDPDGLDNIPFTEDDGLRPKADSPLCNKGEGGADIGAYPCIGHPWQFSTTPVVFTPPPSPQNLPPPPTPILPPPIIPLLNIPTVNTLPIIPLLNIPTVNTLPIPTPRTIPVTPPLPISSILKPKTTTPTKSTKPKPDTTLIPNNTNPEDLEPIILTPTNYFQILKTVIKNILLDIYERVKRGVEGVVDSVSL